MADDSNPIPLEPAEPSPPPPPPIHMLVEKKGPDLADEDVACVGCGYNLRGLTPEGRCPECGMVIERSLHGDELLYSSSGYLDSLCRGIRFIFIVLILKAAFMALTIVAGVVIVVASRPPAGDPGPLFAGIASLIGAILSIALVVGWWWFSAPDPSITGVNKGDVARKFVRVTVIINVLTDLGNSTGEIMNVAPGSPLAIAAVGLGVIALLAWATSFFASMIYIRWIARRIPSKRVDDWAKLLMWLGPLLVTVGAICIGMGPLAAFILYIILIFKVWQDVTVVKAEQARRFGGRPEGLEA